MAEKVPGWVERLLIPTLEARVRSIVKEEVGHLEKNMDAKFEGIESRFDAIDARLVGIDARFEGMESRFEGMESR